MYEKYRFIIVFSLKISYMRRISNVILSNTLERNTHTHTCMESSLSMYGASVSCAIDSERSLSVHFWSFLRSAPAHACKGTTERGFTRIRTSHRTPNLSFDTKGRDNGGTLHSQRAQWAIR